MATHDLTFPLLINHLEDITDGLEEKMKQAGEFTMIQKNGERTLFKELAPLYNLIATLRLSTSTPTVHTPTLDIPDTE